MKLISLLTGLIGLGTSATAEPVAEKISTNLGVVSMSDAELAERILKREKLGKLHVPTGKLVTADPLVNPDRPAYSKQVEPGEHEVTLYRLTGGDPRVALAELRIAEGIPVKWELAVIEGQDISKLEEDQFFGFPVDAGMGSFFDISAVKIMDERIALEAKERGREDINYHDEILWDELYPTPNSDRPIIHHPIKDKPENMAMFSSGWGDGYYPTFWGLNEAGEPLVLIIDFFVATNGDGRSPREQLSARMETQMSPNEKTASSQAHAAISANDMTSLERLLEEKKITPRTWLFESQTDIQERVLNRDMV